MLPSDLQEKLNALSADPERPTGPGRRDLGPERPEMVGDEADATGPDTPLRETPEPESPDTSDGPGESLSAVREQLAREQGRREALEREAQFLRSAKGPAQPVAAPEPSQADQFQQILQSIRVDEEEWAGMTADPRFGAARATEALQRLFALSNQTARAQILAELTPLLDARDATLTQRLETRDIHSQFWSQNTDLQPYDEVVQAVALQVGAEQADQQRSNDEIISEVSRRTRATLKQKYGVELSAASGRAAASRATGAVAQRRIAPARADMGGTAGAPAEKTPAWQQKLYQLAHRA